LKPDRAAIEAETISRLQEIIRFDTTNPPGNELALARYLESALSGEGIPVTLLETWRAMEGLVDEGRCKAIGLSDVNLEQAKAIFEAARIKPAVVHVESHPYLPEWELLNYCKKNGIVLQAFAALGHSSKPRLLEDPVITAIARRVNKTPAQVLLAWAIQRGTALLTTSKTPGRIKENFEVSAIPEGAVSEITEGIKSRVRFNAVVETGVPGFIPRGK